MSIFQRLLNLTEASDEAADLRFMVVTSAGLQHLSLAQALKLLPTTEQVVTERIITEPAPENPLIQQLVDQLADYEKRYEAMAEELSEVQTDLLKQLKKLSKKPFVPEESVALGYGALAGGAVDRENVAIGVAAGAELEGAGNVLVGPHAGANVDGQLLDCTFVGHAAGFGGDQDLTNVTALGAYARATGDNQVALGDYNTNLVTHSGSHRRQDARDMFEPAPLELGLDFVLGITPLQYREDFRDAYIDWDSKPVEPDALRPEPQAPQGQPTEEGYQGELIAYRSDKALWDKEKVAYETARVQYYVDLTQWVDDNRLARINADGTHAGTRLHYGFNAHHLIDALERLGVDASFVQDHAINGGESVKTLSTDELVPILWKSLQDMHARFTSPQFLDELASALYQRHQTLNEATQAQTPVGSDLPAED